MDADVVQDCRVLEPLALTIGQSMDRAGLIEERRREPCDLHRVLGPVIAALRELDDASTPDVGIPIGLHDLLPVTRHIVEDEAFAQRQVAERQVRRAESPQDRVEQDRAGDGQVGTPRLEARYAEAALETQRHEVLAQPV